MYVIVPKGCFVVSLARMVGYKVCSHAPMLDDAPFYQLLCRGLFEAKQSRFSIIVKVFDDYPRAFQCKWRICFQCCLKCPVFDTDIRFAVERELLMVGWWDRLSLTWRLPVPSVRQSFGIFTFCCLKTRNMQYRYYSAQLMMLFLCFHAWMTTMTLSNWAPRCHRLYWDICRWQGVSLSHDVFL